MFVLVSRHSLAEGGLRVSYHGGITTLHMYRCSQSAIAGTAPMLLECSSRNWTLRVEFVFIVLPHLGRFISTR